MLWNKDKKMRKKVRRIVYIGLVILMLVPAGCGKDREQDSVQKPNISQIRSICELATLECYYHNVVKGTVEGGWFKDGWNDGWDIVEWMKKAHVSDCEYWFEYVGIIKIGIDMESLNIEIKGEEVNITIPKAKILSSQVEPESLDKGLYVVSSSDDDGAWITLEHETEAISLAQENMNQQTKENTLLFEEASERAKKLIQNYVQQMGKLAGKEYNIHWIEVENNSGEEKSSENEQE